MAKNAQQITVELEQWAAQEMAELALEVDANLRERTPVDTGHARANWVPAVGTPHAVEESGTGGAAHAAGVAQVLTYRTTDGSLFVSNRVPYITKLNEGSSSQAPALFVQGSIADAIAGFANRKTR